MAEQGNGYKTQDVKILTASFCYYDFFSSVVGKQKEHGRNGLVAGSVIMWLLSGLPGEGRSSKR